MANLRRSLVRLSHGKLPIYSVLREFKSVQLIYSGSYDEDTPYYISSKKANIIRSLTGARFIHALVSPISASPLAQTNMFDYRTSQISDDGKITNFGPVLPCLEAIVTDYIHYKAENRQGVLLVHGTSLNSAHWVSTGIIGNWGKDGCLRVQAKQKRDETRSRRGSILGEEIPVR